MRRAKHWTNAEWLSWTLTSVPACACGSARSRTNPALSVAGHTTPSSRSLFFCPRNDPAASGAWALAPSLRSDRPLAPLPIFRHLTRILEVSQAALCRDGNHRCSWAEASRGGAALAGGFLLFERDCAEVVSAAGQQELCPAVVRTTLRTLARRNFSLQSRGPSVTRWLLETRSHDEADGDRQSHTCRIYHFSPGRSQVEGRPALNSC